MSKLTDKIAYLKGLAEGLKLDPAQDSNRVILGILEVLGEVGDSFEALAEAHGELSDYVDSIDEDLADLEADLFDDENDDEYEEDDDEDDEYDEDDDEYDEDEDDGDDTLLYECPHCHQNIELDPDEMDSEEEYLCPVCGKELFPDWPEEVD